MSEVRIPGTHTEAWFKELENRLERARARLEDAELHARRSLSKSAEIHRHLSLVQEVIAEIEDRVATLLAEAGGERAATHLEPPEAAIVFREVPGFPGYRVGSDGSVWGSRRAGRGYGRTRDWRALKPYLVRPGPAPTVSLYRERVRHPLRVDAVVLLAFVGSCPDGFEVAHANRDPLDNRVDNLRYVALQRADEFVSADTGLLSHRNGGAT